VLALLWLPGGCRSESSPDAVVRCNQPPRQQGTPGTPAPLLMSPSPINAKSGSLTTLGSGEPDSQLSRAGAERLNQGFSAQFRHWHPVGRQLSTKDLVSQFPISSLSWELKGKQVSSSGWVFRVCGGTLPEAARGKVTVSDLRSAEALVGTAHSGTARCRRESGAGATACHLPT